MNDPSDKSSKWAAPGGDMDDYFDEAQALRDELTELKKKLIWLEYLSDEEDKIAARAKEVEGILAGRDNKLIAADKEIKHQSGLRAVAENTAERLTRELKAEREKAAKEKAALEKSETRLKSENTRLRGDKRLHDIKFWSAVGLGVAGTIWGSLGNPLPSFSGDPIETAQTDPINQCILAQQNANAARISNGQTPPPDPIVAGAGVFPDVPEFLMLQKSVVDDLAGRVTISDLDYDIDANYNGPSTLIITGSISNTGTEDITGVSFSAHYLSAANGNCRYGGTYGAYTPTIAPRYDRQPQPLFVRPGETKRFTATAQLPRDRAGLDGGEWRFSNPMIQ